MKRRARFGILGGTVLALATLAIAEARFPSLGASLQAAYRAFRDPTLLEPRQAPEESTLDCRRFADEAPPAGDEEERRFEAAIRREFVPLPPDHALDDPDGATLAALTLPDLKVPITRRTLRVVRFLAHTDAGRAAFLLRFRRAGATRHIIEETLREAGMPEDLLWLAAVESAFDPHAVSPKGAAGLFQFMPETGQLYGLDQSPWVDERRNIRRATVAAVAHLRDLYERFRRWDLALAAYNAGYDRVLHALEKVAKARGPLTLEDKPIGFADLAAASALPQETINYVPQILAFAIVAANRTRFGLDGPELDTPLDMGEIAVPQGTRLRTIARAAGISVATLRGYNPQLLRDRTPPMGGDYLVNLPSDRIAQALATFPAYLEQEILAENEVEAEVGSPLPEPLVAADAAAEPDPSDAPLLKRPAPLGRNRLPSFDLPGERRLVFSAGMMGEVAALHARLPESLALPTLGWQRPADPFDLLSASASSSLGAKTGSAALTKELAFLETPSQSVDLLSTFTLPNGILIRLRKDPGAAFTTVMVRVASTDEGARKGSERHGASEQLFTLRVARADIGAAVELAAARLRLALGSAELAKVSEIRRRAGLPRRAALESAPYGKAWLALSEALFPSGHPLEGTVVGAMADIASSREMLLAGAMRDELARSKASITLVGDIDEAHIRKITEAFLGNLSLPKAGPLVPHPREERLVIEDDVPSPRALYAWIGPGEGEVGDASLRVLCEMLSGQKNGRLERVLVSESRLASLANAHIEVGPRASVVAIEIAPTPGRELDQVEKRLDEELARLGEKNPPFDEVNTARYWLKSRLERENKASLRASELFGPVHSSSPLALRHALYPQESDRALEALGEVTTTTVASIARRVFAPNHRVVVITAPIGTKATFEQQIAKNLKGSYMP